jgi:hypothetical protein
MVCKNSDGSARPLAVKYNQHDWNQIFDCSKTTRCVCVYAVRFCVSKGPLCGGGGQRDISQLSLRMTASYVCSVLPNGMAALARRSVC